MPLGTPLVLNDHNGVPVGTYPIVPPALPLNISIYYLPSMLDVVCVSNN